MYFPTSLKLVGAVLLSALVANAAPPALLRIMTLTTLVDSKGNDVWSNPDGYNLKEVPDDSDDNKQFNPKPSIYAMYQAMDKGWMDDNRKLVNPVFGLTTTNGEKMEDVDEKELKQKNLILKSGFAEDGRYWVVRRRSPSK